SFDVIIGIDWFSDHKAEIICHEKVVRIPLLGGEVIRVLGEKPKREGYVINRDGIHVDPSKIEAVKNWKALRTSFGVRPFLELVRPRIRMCVDAKRILSAQKEASDESVPLKGAVRTLIMDEAYKSKYYVYPGANNMYYDLKDRKCRSLIMWAEIREGQLIGPERRKPLEFSVGDYVLLKVSPWKGVVRFRKKGNLAPRFVGPFEIIEKVGPMAYRLDFPEELNGVHGSFYVSNLKKYLADPTL
nr:putative reverse transcriptase domain-containing protein [Tanacetum cinerariifolium]